MNTVIYARYSAGPRQTDQSIDGQLRVCTEFCKQRGLTVIDTYCDRHISGRTDERPEFQRLIADAKTHKFEAVGRPRQTASRGNKYDSAILLSESSGETAFKYSMPLKPYRKALRELSSRALWKALQNTTLRSSRRRSSAA